MNEIDTTRMPVVRIEDGEAMADSRDVASYFGKNHADVMRDIRNLIEKEPDLGLRNFAETPYVEPQNGQTYKSYAMDRRGFSLLAMGFSGAKALRWKLRYLDAFDAMESELRRRGNVDVSAVLSDPAAMRGLLLTYTEKVLALEATNKEMEADVAALDRIATADGSLNVTEAAKALQVRPKDLFAYLRAHGWIYRRTGASHDLGYQSKVAAGLLEHKVTTITRGDGSEKITEQVRVTPKGLATLAKVFPSSVIAA